MKYQIQVIWNSSSHLLGGCRSGMAVSEMIQQTNINTLYLEF